MTTPDSGGNGGSGKPKSRNVAPDKTSWPSVKDCNSSVWRK